MCGPSGVLWFYITAVDAARQVCRRPRAPPGSMSDHGRDPQLPSAARHVVTRRACALVSPG